VSRIQDALNPPDPSLTKSKMLQHKEDSIVFHFVKSFLKIKLNNNNLLLRFLAEVNILKCPSQAIMNCSALNKSILILMDCRNNNSLHSISQNFSEKFKSQAKKRNWPIIIYKFRIILLGDQRDKCTVDALNIKVSIIEGRAK
jgi:hypothetical protein